MTFEIGLWWVMAAVAVACAAGMISAKNPVHSALWLVGNFIGLAVIYLVLSAPVLFAIQLIVYAGAIMVLFLFVIMFFMSPEARSWRQRALRRQYVVGSVLVLAFVVLFSIAVLGTDAGDAFSDQLAVTPPGLETHVAQQQQMGQPAELGAWLFQFGVLPFELTSLLLLIAILGALMVARDVRSEGREQLPEFAATVHEPGAEPPGQEVEQ
jgi:NADH-quinone oxidoreductase subunit J